MGRPKIDITGRRFGRLVALREAYMLDGISYWECKCDCGNYITTRKRALMGGNSRSCGCLRNELTAERNRRRAADKAKGNKLY